jgi:hypothetical protein
VRNEVRHDAHLRFEPLIIEQQSMAAFYPVRRIHIKRTSPLGSCPPAARMVCIGWCAPIAISESLSGQNEGVGKPQTKKIKKIKGLAQSHTG